jgi:hypothetical protein
LPVAARRIDERRINQAAENAEEARSSGICCPDCASETAQKKATATAPIENHERPPIRAIAATRN